MQVAFFVLASSTAVIWPAVVGGAIEWPMIVMAAAFTLMSLSMKERLLRDGLFWIGNPGRASLYSAGLGLTFAVILFLHL